MGNLRLHLDADTSRVSLWRALLERGYDVTRTPNDWMQLDASDEQQLLGATAQGRCIFTFNIRDFVHFSRTYPRHGGIILSTQRPMPELLRLLDEFLQKTSSQEMIGQVRWLSRQKR